MKSVERRMTLVLDRVVRLKKLAGRIQSFAEYQESTDWKDLAERNLQIAIEGCLDIGKIIISQRLLRDPKDNKDIFVVLAEAEIISARSFKFLAPMAGTRNILVHGYDKVEDSLIYNILKKHLNDFDLFLAEVRDTCFGKNQELPFQR